MNINDLNELGARSNKVLGYELQDLMKLPYIYIKETLVEQIANMQTETFESEKFLMENIRLIVKSVIDANNLSINDKQYNGVSDSVVLSLFFNINDQLTELLQLEQDHLQSTPDAILIQAGVMRLNQLGEMVTLMNLSKGDYFLAKKLGAEPYEDIFWLLSYNLISNDIERKVNEITSKRNAHK